MNRTRKVLVWMTIALAGSIGVGAMGLAEDPAGAENVRTVDIRIRFSRFDPGNVMIAPGETVRFVIENSDPIDHEFIVGDSRLQLTHERGTEAHHAPRPGEISLPAGATRSTTVTFPVDLGATLFGCHLPGHYAYGMVGAIEAG